VNSNADSVSVIDTTTDQEIERIDVRLAEDALPGASPESLALSEDERTLYVANAHSNAIAIVALSEKARGAKPARKSPNPQVENPGLYSDRSISVRGRRC